MAVYFTENRISWVYVQSLGKVFISRDLSLPIIACRVSWGVCNLYFSQGGMLAVRGC